MPKLNSYITLELNEQSLLIVKRVGDSLEGSQKTWATLIELSEINHKKLSKKILKQLKK